MTGVDARQLGTRREWQGEDAWIHIDFICATQKWKCVYQRNASFTREGITRIYQSDQHVWNDTVEHTNV
eukprot:5203350-Prorocentrum_lima.AAC.1